MRIIAGEWKGRRLPKPAAGVRPTPDRAREALFSILTSKGLYFAGSRWLELYCGSGAVGLEALSRGAGHVVFADSSRKVLRAVEGFLKREKARERAELIQANLPRQLDLVARLGGEPVFDVIFADPPFAEPVEPDHLLTHPALPRIADAGTLVIWERESGREPIDSIPGWDAIDSRAYGRIEFVFLQRSRP